MKITKFKENRAEFLICVGNIKFDENATFCIFLYEKDKFLKSKSKKK